MSFLGEFSPILGSKRLFAVCTTVVQLGILRLMRIFLRRENWCSYKNKENTTKMAVESAIFRQKSPHKF